MATYVSRNVYMCFITMTDFVYLFFNYLECFAVFFAFTPT